MRSANESWTYLLPGSLRELLHGRLQLQKILSNIAWLSVDKLMRLGVGAVVGVWIARYLGPDRFGLLNYTAAFVALFSPLASLGIESILVRDVLVEDDASRNVSMGTAFAMRGTGSLVAAILSCALILVLRPGDPLTIAMIAIAGGGLMCQSFDVIDLWFHSQVKAKWGVYPRNAAFLLMTAVRVVLLVRQAPLIAFAWAATGELALSAAGLIAMYAYRGGHLQRWHANFRRAISFLKDSWPLAFANLAVILYMRIGQVMLGNIMNNTEVGIYSVAVRLAEMWYFIPMSIASSVFPSVIKARRDDAILYQRRLEMFYGMMSMIALSVAVTTFLFTDFIIKVLFGSKYAGAGSVLSVYVWASIPVFLNIASTQYLIAENKTTVALLRTLAGSVANVALNIVLIPRYGGVGAAWASLISYTMTTVFIAAVPGLRGQAAMMLRSLNPWSVFQLFRNRIPRTAP